MTSFNPDLVVSSWSSRKNIFQKLESFGQCPTSSLISYMYLGKSFNFGSLQNFNLSNENIWVREVPVHPYNRTVLK
jgi:hypothetical protein